jgi:endonuclease/exonuclease/phosphatase family metal-dependent hydrolase
MTKLFSNISLILALCFFAGCDSFSSFKESLAKTSGDSAFAIATWNLQAIFDGSDDGIEYEEYSAKSGWTAEKYKARLNTLAKAALSLVDGGGLPDAIALIEVENSKVLTDLSGDYLKKYGFKYTFFTGHPGYSLGVGFLSRFPITKSSSHSILNGGAVLPRPIAEIWLEPGGHPLVVFVCHWKSKLGGEEYTEALRRDAAKVLNRRITAIKTENPLAGIVVLGDLNENHDEFFRTGESFVTALLPDTEEAAIIAEKSGYLSGENQSFLIVSGEKPPGTNFFPNSDVVLYTPWENELQGGSYYYQKKWETIDHFLLSASLFDGAGWEFQSAYVCDVEPFTNSAGTPAVYNARTGSGISDHLPMVLKLKK